MRSTPTASPGREARDTSFMWCRMSATRQRLIGPGTLEARTDLGTAKSCLWSLSRSSPVATFCFFFGERQTISKAFAVLQTMVGARNSYSQSKDRAKNWSAIMRSSRLDFSRPCLSAVEHATTRQRAARLMEWMPTRSGPRPHKEPTPRELEGIALYGPAVVH